MSKKNTQHKRGIEHHRCKLTPEDIVLIRALAAEREKMMQQARNLSNKKIAEKFNVNASTVDKIVNLRSWVHVY